MTCGKRGGGTLTAASVPRGGIRRCEIRGQERRQEKPAKNEHQKDTRNATTGRGIQTPARTTIKEFKAVHRAENP